MIHLFVVLPKIKSFAFTTIRFYVSITPSVTTRSPVDKKHGLINTLRGSIRLLFTPLNIYIYLVVV